jgi:predicted dithiol-disulfide oxidoreductase (DUF899 family)
MGMGSTFQEIGGQFGGRSGYHPSGTRAQSSRVLKFAYIGYILTPPPSHRRGTMTVRFPNESPEYRKARDELFKAEDELRELTEKVAAQRRALPLGGALKEAYLFEEMGPDGQVREVSFAELFDKGSDQLFLYGFMYGPKMKEACSLCTSFLDGLNAAAPTLKKRISLAVVATSPIDRIVSFAHGRGWQNLRVLSSGGNSYQRDYFAETEGGSQMPMANVFVKNEKGIFHTWGSELLYGPRASFGDHRHIDMGWALWNVLDYTPGGRGADFYPSLDD